MRNDLPYTGPRRPTAAKPYRTPVLRLWWWRFTLWLHRIVDPGLRRQDGCDEPTCRGRAHDHRRCYWCKNLTCAGVRLYVDPTSLRRRMVTTCDNCALTVSRDHAVQARTSKDWAEITVPIEMEAIDTTRMAEQFASISRAAIRAFRASEEPFATVNDDVPAGVVQDSIRSLGLEDEMYAEQRNGSTVLRRIARK